MAGSAVARCEGCSSGRGDDITPLKVILILPRYCLLLSARLSSAPLSFQCSASVLCCLISCVSAIDEVCEKTASKIFRVDGRLRTPNLDFWHPSSKLGCNWLGHCRDTLMLSVPSERSGYQ